MENLICATCAEQRQVSLDFLKEPEKATNRPRWTVAEDGTIPSYTSSDPGARDYILIVDISDVSTYGVSGHTSVFPATDIDEKGKYCFPDRDIPDGFDRWLKLPVRQLRLAEAKAESPQRVRYVDGKGRDRYAFWLDHETE
jgi:hypothetical protein